MLTCCPACRTCFRITEAQLAVAQGKVRCGKCKTVFNARQHLQTPPGQSPAASAVTTPAPPAESQEELSPLTSKDTNYIDLFSAPEPESESKSESEPESEPEPEVSTPRYRYNDFTDEMLSEHELDDILAEMDQQLSSGIDNPGPELSDPLIMPDALQPAADDHQDELGEAIDSLFKDIQAEDVPADVSPIETEDAAWLTTDEASDLDSLTADAPASAPDDSQIDFPDETPELGEEPDEQQTTSSTSTEPDAVPLRLRDSLAVQPPQSRSWLATLGGSLLILLLLVLLIGQLILFRPLDVARLLPQTQPYLEQVCQQLPCHFQTRRDPEQIRLLDRDVRAHPEQDNTLLITATLRNQASFAQAYPDLRVTLFDLSGNKVAQRRFTPADYLGGLYTPFMQMQPDTPLHIRLEVLDPGANAVNFEFDVQ